MQQQSESVKNKRSSGKHVNVMSSSSVRTKPNAVANQKLMYQQRNNSIFRKGVKSNFQLNKDESASHLNLATEHYLSTGHEKLKTDTAS